MRLTDAECRARFGRARVARLATVGADRPHLVPVTFALIDGRVGPEGAFRDEVVFGVDQKPKITTDLRRLRNIAGNPHVSLLVDEYDEDWSRLWWVRADGAASVDEVSPARRSELVSCLAARYPADVADPPRGPLVVVVVTRWIGWAAGGR